MPCLLTVVIAFSLAAWPSAAQPPATQPDEVTVTLINAGEAPRRVLRHAPAVGSRGSFAYDLQIQTELWIDGRKEDTPPTPAIRLVIQNEAVERLENGTRLEYEITDAVLLDDDDLPEGVGDPNEGLALLKGMKVSLVLRPNGTVTDLRLSEDDEWFADGIEAMGFAFDQFGVVPDEPVGVGAEWRMDGRMKFDGISARVQVSFKLESIKDEMVTTSISMEFKGGPTAVVAGREVELHVAGTGKGSVSFALDGLTRQSGMTTTHTMDVSVEEVEMRSVGESRYEIEPLQDEAED